MSHRKPKLLEPALLLCVAPLLLSLSSSLSARLLVFGNVSGWTVWTDSDAAYSCFAEAAYEGGSSIRAGYDADRSLYVSFTDPLWRGVAADRTYALELEFDDGTVQTFQGMGAGSGSVRFTVPEGSRRAFVEAFVRGYAISVTPGDFEPVMLSLGGSSAALDMLDECQDSMAQFN